MKVVLTISHADHDEKNHEIKLDRLKALCQICHLRYDAVEKYRWEKEKWARQSPKLLKKPAKVVKLVTSYNKLSPLVTNFFADKQVFFWRV